MTPSDRENTDWVKDESGRFGDDGDNNYDSVYDDDDDGDSDDEYDFNDDG